MFIVRRHVIFTVFPMLLLFHQAKGGQTAGAAGQAECLRLVPRLSRRVLGTVVERELRKIYTTVPLDAPFGEAPKRCRILFAESVAALRSGHPYWGARFLAWSIHYAQDLTQPRTLGWIPSGHMICWTCRGAVKEGSLRLISYYHTGFERAALWTLKGALGPGPQRTLTRALAGTSTLDGAADPEGGSPAASPSPVTGRWARRESPPGRCSRLSPSGARDPVAITQSDAFGRTVVESAARHPKAYADMLAVLARVFPNAGAATRTLVAAALANAGPPPRAASTPDSTRESPTWRTLCRWMKNLALVPRSSPPAGRARPADPSDHAAESARPRGAETAKTAAAGAALSALFARLAAPRVVLPTWAEIQRDRLRRDLAGSPGRTEPSVDIGDDGAPIDPRGAATAKASSDASRPFARIGLGVGLGRDRRLPRRRARRPRPGQAAFPSIAFRAPPPPPPPVEVEHVLVRSSPRRTRAGGGAILRHSLALPKN